MGRGDAAAAKWIFRGRIAATPRPRRRHNDATRRYGALNNRTAGRLGAVLDFCGGRGEKKIADAVKAFPPTASGAHAWPLFSGDDARTWHPPILDAALMDAVALDELAAALTAFNETIGEVCGTTAAASRR